MDVRAAYGQYAETVIKKIGAAWDYLDPKKQCAPEQTAELALQLNRLKRTSIKQYHALPRVEGTGQKWADVAQIVRTLEKTLDRHLADRDVRARGSLKKVCDTLVALDQQACQLRDSTQL